MKMYCPPECKISKETQWHARWKISGPFLLEKRVGFVRGDGAGDNAAVIRCLRMAWVAYKAAGGIDCPFDLSEGL